MTRAGVLSGWLLIVSAVPTSAAGQSLSTFDVLTAPSTLPAGCALVPAAVERVEGGRVTGGLWAGLRMQSNPWTGETPGVLVEIRTRMFGPSPMPDGPPDARIAAGVARTLVEGLSGYAAVYRQGDARVAVYALRSTDPLRLPRSSRAEKDDGTGQAFARFWKGQAAVLVVGDRGSCFSALEQHLRVAAPIGEIPPAGRPASLLIDRAYITGARARGDNGDAAIRTAIAILEADAAKALAIEPVSVMDKSITPPSGDKHDYVSQAPYWWPDPSKPDGKPYIRKDGERNPEISRITDRDNLGRLGNAVTTLALAYAYTGREAYATHAARLVRGWFLDPETRMNPHLQFGQYVPGINQGRGIGIIETRNLPDLLDGVMLISGSPAWTKADDDGLKAWMRAYLTWLVESTHGREESNNGNNHATWYDVQVAGLALYTGQVDLARRTVEGARARIAAQIEPDGRQPRELERTRSWHYSEFNLAAFMDLATLGRHVGVDLWAYRTADGRSIRRAVDFMVPYAAGERKWAFDQITPFSASALHRILRRGAVAWNEPTYKVLADRVGGGGPRLVLTTP
jgi:hypothetical protein